MNGTTIESAGGAGYEGAVNGNGLPPRRQYAVDQKRRIVEEMFAPGASVSVVARRHDVNSNQVFGCASRTDFEGFLPCPSPDSAFAR